MRRSIVASSLAIIVLASLTMSQMMSFVHGFRAVQRSSSSMALLRRQPQLSNRIPSLHQMTPFHRDVGSPVTYGAVRTYRNVETDEYGRRISPRSRRSSNTRSPPSGGRSNRGGGGWGRYDDDENGNDSFGGYDDNQNVGGWDGFDSSSSSSSNSNDPRRRSSSSSRPQRRVSRPTRDRGPPSSSSSYNDRNRRDRYGDNRGRPGRNNDNYGDRRDGNAARGRAGGNNSFGDKPKKQGGQINMKKIEAAGYVHLYGLSSILNALEANVRDFKDPTSTDGGESESETDSDLWFDDDDADDGEDGDGDGQRDERGPLKPEAQTKPWLFIQERTSSAGRAGTKATSAQRVIQLAETHGIPTTTVDKGVLNTLSGNRPHQGYVLRCGKLSFETISKIPHPHDDPSSPSLWLVLDEVVDPQNLGALLRSAFFLGGDSNVGIMVCSKNSAPPSPVVSAASAGALELATIHSTSSLPRTLNQARTDGFRIVGASSSIPKTNNDDEDAPMLYELNNLPTNRDERPILLVLGSEGHGLRSLVAKSCTEFVRIPGGAEMDTEAGDAGVDSLNVSVTGGILLWHLLHGTAN